MAEAQVNLRQPPASTTRNRANAILRRMGAGQAGRIKKRREDRELSRPELAKAVGVSRQTVFKWERNDQVEISRNTLKRLAKALHCTEAHITDGGPVEAPAAPSVKLDVELLTDALVVVERHAATEGHKLTPEKRGGAALALYEMFHGKIDRPTRDELLQFLKRLI